MTVAVMYPSAFRLSATDPLFLPSSIPRIYFISFFTFLLSNLLVLVSHLVASLFCLSLPAFLLLPREPAKFIFLLSLYRPVLLLFSVTSLSYSACRSRRSFPPSSCFLDRHPTSLHSPFFILPSVSTPSSSLLLFSSRLSASPLSGFLLFHLSLRRPFIPPKSFPPHLYSSLAFPLSSFIVFELFPPFIVFSTVSHVTLRSSDIFYIFSSRSTYVRRCKRARTFKLVKHSALSPGYALRER